MCEDRRLSRRALLARSACVAAGAAISARNLRAMVPELAAGPALWKDQDYKNFRRTAQMFTLDKVKLLAGPYQEAMDVIASTCSPWILTGSCITIACQPG